MLALSIMPSKPSILNFSITPPPSTQMPLEEEEEPHEEQGESVELIHHELQVQEPQEPSLLDELEEMIDLDFVKKPEIVEEEIFANAPPRKRGQPTRSTSPKKTQRRPRKPLSEEDKEKRREALARGRATRMANLEKKRALKLKEESIIDAEKELQLENKQLDLELQNARLNKKTKKVKKVMIADSSSEEEIEYVKAPRKKPRSPPPTRESITAEDVERAQLNTLLAYEKIRKDRKAEKQRIKDIEKQQAQIKQTIQQVNHQQPAWGRHRGAGKYGNLLSGMGL